MPSGGKSDRTTHYSAAELDELIQAAESIVSRGTIETPNLLLIGKNARKSVGKTKGLAEKIG